jgi:hypothetical protein
VLRDIVVLDKQSSDTMPVDDMTFVDDPVKREAIEVELDSGTSARRLAYVLFG